MWFLDIYWASLLILVPCVTLVLGRNIIIRTFGRLSISTAAATATSKICEEEEEKVDRQGVEEASRFRWLFLRVYLLVMGSEWLQVRMNPYLSLA